MRATMMAVRPDGSTLLTTKEAAEFLRIAAGTLKHWVHRKRIEHVKIGRMTRFRKSALEKFVMAQTVPADETDDTD